MESPSTAQDSVPLALQRESLAVVVIDNDPDELAILGHHLRKLDDIAAEVHTFARPEQGLEMLRRQSADVLFLDYRLGGRTGIEVLEQIKSEGIDIPAILVTDQGGEDLAVEALHAGFADYIPKATISRESLQRAITNAVEKAALRRSLVRYHQDLERTVSDLDSRNDEIEKFYHSLAHELKTPLTAIREFVSIVLDGLQGPLTGDQRDSLGSAQRACDHMVLCIHDLLDASRLETGKLSLHCLTVPLDKVVEEAIKQATPASQAKGIAITFVAPAEISAAYCDRQRILQVLSNLIGNAIKFTDTGGQIAIQVNESSASPDYLSVSVQDNGRGISSDKTHRIFDRLYQAFAGDAAAKGGLGLGLNLCRGLVRLHGGTIEVESKLGSGSTFTFTLPSSNDNL